MKLEVISAFIDKRDGRQVNPGEPVPEGLDRDTVKRLVAAQCLRPLEAETPTPSQAENKPGGGTDLFPDEDDEEEDDGEGEGGSWGETGAGDAPAGQSAAPGASAPSARRPRRPAGAAQ
jgi:hypothetical protein